MKREIEQNPMELKRKNGSLWRGAGILTLAFLLAAGVTACGDDEADSAPQEDTMEQPSTDPTSEQEDMGTSGSSGSEESSGTMQSDEMNDGSTAEMPSQEEAMPQSDTSGSDQAGQSTDQGDQDVDETREPMSTPSEETQDNQTSQ